MDDKLKNFIQQNRDAFDSEQPGQAVFGRISDNIQGDKKKPVRFLMPWAAVISSVVLLSVASLVYFGKNKIKSDVPVVTQPETPQDEISFIGDPSYAKQIYHFRELIGLKQAELRQLEKDYPDLYKQFVADINQLDSSYQNLKINLAENPNREMLLEAMIQNLQLQSELLNRQLSIIKEIKQKTQSHEKRSV